MCSAEGLQFEQHQTLESVPLSLLSCLLLQDSASLKVLSSCTPAELMELAVRKWLTTHGPEEEAWRGQYVLRVSQCLEFLCGDHPLIQYKVSFCTVTRSGVSQRLMETNPDLDLGVSGLVSISQPEMADSSVIFATVTAHSLFYDR